MTRSSLSRASSLVTRGLRASTAGAARYAPVRKAAAPNPPRTVFLAPGWRSIASQSRFLSATSSRPKGILPDTDDPEPPNVLDQAVKAVPAKLSEDDYHDLADEYLDVIQDRLEEIAEQNDQVDVEYSSGVLNVTFPNIGTYVINKQPPNKQIWLSSPISGPKRYDYVVYGEGQANKEDTAVGDWVYLRDGTTMSDLFSQELDIDLELPPPQ